MKTNSFNTIFNQKGLIGGIAEKAFRNFELKSHQTKEGDPEIETPERLRYFAIGYAFKQIDPSVMDFKTDANGEVYSQNFPYLFEWYKAGNVSDIKQILIGLRNINSHYIHLFSPIEINSISHSVAFLKEAFACAIEQVYIESKEKDKIQFLAKRFLPRPRKTPNISPDEYAQKIEIWKEDTRIFKEQTFDEAIDDIFFIRAESSFFWKIDNTHECMPIKQGTYLSFYACLFILALFLYKHEAQLLISRIPGFKRNGTQEERSKLEIFNLFSKRFSSQDIDNEEKNLARFHDLIVYLNRFPTVWNEHFNNSVSPTCPQAVAQLTKYLDGRKQQEDDRRDAEEKSSALPRPQKVSNKVDSRIHSYPALFGRNKDRFLLFAARFFAETDFFGSETRFKCYQYDSPQLADREQAKLNLDTKERDKLKYYQGRVIYFTTFAQHHARYPNWDTPFVIQADTIQIQLTLQGHEIIVTLQRELAAHLLERALSLPAGNRRNAGREILNDYYEKQRRSRDGLLITLFNHPADICNREARQLLPKRLLPNYINGNRHPVNPLEKIYKAAVNAQRRYDEEKETAEKGDYLADFLKLNKGKRYKLEFVRKAWHYMSFRELYRKRKEALADRDRRETADKGHHKSLHITRDQFNDFSRWMYAFGPDNPNSKKCLHHLFERAGFLEDKLFKRTFENASSLDGLFEQTLNVYRDWFPTQSISGVADGKYSPENYKQLLAAQTLYINFSHFLRHSSNPVTPGGRYGAGILPNRDKLIDSFYGIDYFAPYVSNWDACSKADRRLHKQLVTARYEDSILYELAWHYRAADLRLPDLPKEQQTPVTSIYNEPITLLILDRNQKPLFNLQYPFRLIDRLAEDIWLHQEKLGKKKVNSFLENIPGYFESVNKELEMKYLSQHPRPKDPDYTDIISIADRFAHPIDSLPTLTNEDIYIIKNHVVKFASKVAKEIMQIEKKALCMIPNICSLIKSNRIDLNKMSINGKECFMINQENIRNIAMHFDIPTKQSYMSILKSLKRIKIEGKVQIDKDK